MDLTAEFYLQTVEKVFIEHALPKGTFTHRNQLIDPSLITKTALMTVEGERDDISGVGQTQAAHDLCQYHNVAAVGHAANRGASQDLGALAEFLAPAALWADSATLVLVIDNIGGRVDGIGALGRASNGAL